MRRYKERQDVDNSFEFNGLSLTPYNGRTVVDALRFEGDNADDFMEFYDIKDVSVGEDGVLQAMLGDGVVYIHEYVWVVQRQDSELFVSTDDEFWEDYEEL